ncbi:MAG: hypothetical protein QXX93_03540 [Desulfurococcaceae archaeon]
MKVYMKSVLNTVVMQLENLIRVLEEKNYPDYCRREVARLKTKLENAQAPLIPSRVIWDKYIALMSAIEEAIATASREVDKLVVCSIINGVKEYSEGFCSALRRSYYIERIQIALPVIVAFSAFAYRVLNEISPENLYLLATSLVSLVLVFAKPIVGLALLGLLGVLVLYTATTPVDSMLGVLLLFASVSYTYVLYTTRSAGFEKKLREVSESIRSIIVQGMKPRGLDVDEALSQAIEKYRVPSNGIFKFIDKTEVLRYKAVLMKIAVHNLSIIKGVETRSNGM